MCKSYTCFVNLFLNILNGIVLLISFLICSPLVQRKTINFFVLIFYLATLVNLFSSCHSLFFFFCHSLLIPWIFYIQDDVISQRIGGEGKDVTLILCLICEHICSDASQILLWFKLLITFMKIVSFHSEKKTFYGSQTLNADLNNGILFGKDKVE